MIGIKKRTMQEFCDFFNIYLCKNAEGAVQIFTAKPVVCNGYFTGCRFYSSARITDFISDIENLKKMEKIEPCHTTDVYTNTADKQRREAVNTETALKKLEEAQE